VPRLAETHLLCAALVAIDLIARTLRMRVLLRSLGHRVPDGRLLATALVGDAASALTPFRAGGDLARLAALRRAGVPAGRAMLALAGEVAQTWAVILAGGALLLRLYGGAAWRSFIAGFALDTRVSPAGAAVLVLVSGVLGAGLLVSLRRTLRVRPAPSPAKTSRVRLSVGRLLSTLPLTAISIGARVAILPVLTASMPSLPSFGTVAASSFLLLHGQMILPTPAGAGAVDLGFLAGLGTAGGGLLMSWRLYTTGIGAIVGSALAAVTLGGRILRRRRPALESGGECP
jgi:uncharacterized membrane protein YbhN (UPF0104 family)